MYADIEEERKSFIAEPFFSPVVRWIANTVVFPLSRTGDVRVYNQKELQLFFELADFTDIESYTRGTVLFFLQGRERHLVGQKNENRRGSKMKMPERDRACHVCPCGMNCLVCYKHYLS